MKKKTHTESEMVNAVKELESGIDANRVARDHDVQKATLYNRKSEYSGMEVSQVEHLHELVAENIRLKRPPGSWTATMYARMMPFGERLPWSTWLPYWSERFSWVWKSILISR